MSSSKIPTSADDLSVVVTLPVSWSGPSGQPVSQASLPTPSTHDQSAHDRFLGGVLPARSCAKKRHPNPPICPSSKIRRLSLHPQRKPASVLQSRLDRSLESESESFAALTASFLAPRSRLREIAAAAAGLGPRLASSRASMSRWIRSPRSERQTDLRMDLFFSWSMLATYTVAESAPRSDGAGQALVLLSFFQLCVLEIGKSALVVFWLRFSTPRSQPCQIFALWFFLRWPWPLLSRKPLSCSSSVELLFVWFSAGFLFERLRTHARVAAVVARLACLCEALLKVQVRRVPWSAIVRVCTGLRAGLVLV